MPRKTKSVIVFLLFYYPLFAICFCCNYQPQVADMGGLSKFCNPTSKQIKKRRLVYDRSLFSISVMICQFHKPNRTDQSNEKKTATNQLITQK